MQKKFVENLPVLTVAGWDSNRVGRVRLP